MSLINDALKRARDSQRKTPPPGAPPLPPVEPPARAGAGWLLGLAAIVFLAAAVLLLGVALFKREATPAEAAKAPESPPTAAPAQVAVAPVSNSVPVLAPVSNAPPAASNTNPPPAPPVEQLPKVQGIIFNSARPLGIVNGKTVYVGDYVGDFQVKQILKNSIVFQRRDGSQKMLLLGE